jgi:hypothetical protein
MFGQNILTREEEYKFIKECGVLRSVLYFELSVNVSVLRTENKN